MKVLLIGPASFPGGLVGSYARAFGRLGAVVLFDTVAEGIGPLYSPLDTLLARAARKVAQHLSYAVFRRKLLARARAGAYEGVGLVVDFASKWLDAATLGELRGRLDVPVFHLNADSPFDDFNAHANLARCLPLYDCYLTPYRGLMPRLRDAGARRVEHLPFAWDADLHPHIPADASKTYAHGLAFAGSWTPEREAWLGAVSDLDLTIWGPRWGRARSEYLRARVRLGPLVFGGSALATVARAARINLNFLRPQCAGAHNMRTFEVTGSGGFLLTERSEEQSELFAEGAEIACFASVADLREQVASYLPRDALRERMAAAAHARATGHTYVHRARSVLDLHRALAGTTAVAAGEG
ncbi:MAG: glycosyltransferase [Chloroflexi bacterium]|nr:glycosyltransferase [Chloroflexota bacterium]